jgi:hypothetical protein
MTRTLQLIALLLVCFLPELALANTINPPGGNAWDLWVFGNGEAIYEILNSIKLLMVPVSGNSAYRSLLLLIAIISFIVLAVSAGFDPAKNFMKMFTYVFVVWFISFGTTTLTVNVQVNDSLNSNQPPVIDKVPALVVLPGILTGLVGKYFTDSIETNFSIVGQDSDAFLLGETGIGQFNLFGKMLQESSQYVITIPELKKSLSQYTTDCVVPAMGLGRLRGPVPAEGGGTEVTEGFGLTALLRTTDMMTTLSSAKNKGILTKYYPSDTENQQFRDALGTDDSGTSDTAYRATGALISCSSAYDLIRGEMEQHAEKLLDAGNQAWAKAGVMPIYDTAFKSMLLSTSMVGTGGSPSSYIMQTSMVNSMNGAFRQAAIQTGNNSMMQAVALSQAEASQWSAWTAGFSTFNNTMGYVYVVLQAFIFAITPLIIVALLIPGMGKTIFVNYAQILVWLTLWMPSLAIINYLIMLFATTSVGGVASSTGGMSMANKALISESVNHLMVAAQFLGTMVPLISWGIVKGAMAFTEFISHGIGNQFAGAAGASAATGNLSLNNVGMDNTSMNKYSTMASSQVGFQAVSAVNGIGSMELSSDRGGQDTSQNGSKVSMKSSMTDSLQRSLSDSVQMTSALQAMQNNQMSISELESLKADSSLSSAQQQAVGRVLSNLESHGYSSGVGHGLSTGDGVNSGTSGSNVEAAALSSSMSGKGSIGVGTPGISPIKGSLSGEASMGTTGTTTDSLTNSNGHSMSADSGMKVDAGTTSMNAGGSLGSSVSASGTFTQAGSQAHSASKDYQHAYQEAVSQSLSEQRSITSQLTSSLQASQSSDFAMGVTNSDANVMSSDFTGMRSNLGAGISGAESARAGMQSDLTGRQSSHSATTSGFQAKHENVLGGLRASAGSHGGAPGSVPGESNFQAAMEAAKAQVAAGKTEATGQYSTLKGAADARGGYATEQRSKAGATGVGNRALGLVKDALN